MSSSKGLLLYSGPSMLDGHPIVVVATGLGRPSSNKKTGPMVQTWILRADMGPQAAVAMGADVSICGGCPHRGHLGIDRSCYVAVSRAPASVYKAWRRGVYRDAVPGDFAGKLVRIGSYGDPAAVPGAVWTRVASEAKGVSGYTHQWRWATHLRRFAMASVDSVQEAFEAQAAGWRTFRVAEGFDPLPFESLCPASDEGGHRTDCASCLRCNGSRGSDLRYSVVIPAHGPGKRATLRVLREVAA